ncbi:MAG TPA: hypothetical protein VK973_10370 [Arenicellales bacterium]|nr:hypothetical protein [Arenicellales bacterium]
MIDRQVGRAHGTLPPLLFACLLAAAALYARANLDYAGLWWDETAQFWISQGIDHYAAPGAKPQGVTEALRLNRLQNLDPGGFTILEHYWTRAGRGVAWIRALPFSFFLALMLGTGLLAWRLSRDKYLTLLGAALPLAYPGALYFGLENRAYAMEMAGVALGLLLVLRALERPTVAALSLAGLAGALFMTSRYSYVFFLGAAALTIVYARPAGPGRGILAQGARLAAFLAPAVVVGLVIFQYMLRDQLWPEMTAAEGLGITAPVYARSSVLAGHDNPLNLVYRNIGSVPALPITLTIAYFLFIQGRVHRWILGRYPGARLDYATSPVFVFVLAFQAIAIIMSYSGLYPWDIEARWSAHLLVISMIAALGMLAEGRMLWRACTAAGAAPAAVVRMAACTAVAAFVGAASVHAAGYRIADATDWPDISAQVRQYRALDEARGRVFVTWYEVPAVRYLYEFGPFRGRAEYPQVFRFESRAEWAAQAPVNAHEENLGYVISAKPLRELQERFPGAPLAAAGPGPAPLLKIGRHAEDRQ